MSAADRARLVAEVRENVSWLFEVGGEVEQAMTARDALNDSLDRLATALEAADADAKRLRSSLNWALDEISDNAESHDDSGIPDHLCEFYSNPEKGACDFHEQWADAECLTGRIDCAAEEPTR